MKYQYIDETRTDILIAGRSDKNGVHADQIFHACFESGLIVVGQ
jgi:hypothetical protein